MNPVVKSLVCQPTRPSLLGMRADEIGRRLRELREAKGLSQAQLAGRAGVDPTQLARVERGQSEPSVKWLERVAVGLEVGFLVEFVDVTPRIVRDSDNDQIWRFAVDAYLRSKRGVGVDGALEARLRAVRHNHLEQEPSLEEAVHRARVELEGQHQGRDETQDHPRIDVPPKRRR